MVRRTGPSCCGMWRITNWSPPLVNSAAHTSTAGAATAVMMIRTARASSNRRISLRPSELRREVDVQPRTGIGRERLGDVDAERHDRQAHPQADAHRILDERRADG